MSWSGALRQSAPLRPLVTFRDARREILDIQFRRLSGRLSRASLYAGLTRILDLDASTPVGKPPVFCYYIAHKTHRMTAGGYSEWSKWQWLDQLADLWPEVERYLLDR